MAPFCELSTPFKPVLDINYAPSDQEKEMIRALLRDPELELENISDEIRKMEEDLARLNARQKELYTFIHCHRMMLSTSRRLHGDILGEIFLQSVTNEGLPVCSLSEAPLSLTMVSRAWREIAITTPRLWTAVDVVLPSSKPEWTVASLRALMKGRTDGVRQWLDRSGSLPINISLRMEYQACTDWYLTLPQNDYGCDKALESICGFTSMVASFCRRWRTLILGLPYSPLLDPFRKLTAKDFPLLVEFIDPHTLQILPDPIPATPIHMLQFMKGAPALQRAQVAAVRPDLLEYSLPLRRLKLLHVSFTEDQNGEAMLRTLSRLCPSLSECAVVLHKFNGMLSDSTQIPLAPNEWVHLHTLKLSLFAIHRPANSILTESIRMMFESVTTPSLTTLSLQIVNCGENMILPSDDLNEPLPFHNLILRSQCRLERLELDMGLGSGFSTTLDTLPSLVSLKVGMRSQKQRVSTRSEYALCPEPSYFSQSKSVLAALSHLGGKDAAFPNLHDINFNLCDPGDADLILELAREQSSLNGRLSIVKAEFRGLSVSDVEILGNKLGEWRKGEGSCGVKMEWAYAEGRLTRRDCGILPSRVQISDRT
ncbi:hypothetical protein AAF712_002537 [Marasmius tenuissimus]|uniref:F-box domain-containing protein n=1 Tax=Marasmius tenuissimus TaxID=585030 RepID=A0ABR3AAF2_9AGAR|nr:hypothetical protein PM082_009673 [Marasmius tenuissimus]